MTLTLTSDDLRRHIVAHVLSTSTNITYWLVATLRLIVDGRTDGRMDGHVFTNSMSHLCSSAEMTENETEIRKIGPTSFKYSPILYESLRYISLNEEGNRF